MPPCAHRYLNDRTTKTIVVDPEKGPLIRAAFQMYAEGDTTLAQLRSEINQAGLTGQRGGKLSKSVYHRLLQNPVYYGMIRFRGELHQGVHEPLGSNHQIRDGQLFLRPNGAWQILFTTTLLQNKRQPDVRPAGACSAELVAVPTEAERAGFEPAVGL
jgi:hypothetical protein